MWSSARTRPRARPCTTSDPLSELAPLIREALDRALRAAGWTRLAEGSYERRATREFALGADFWIGGEPTEVQALVSVRCPRLDMALEHLGEDGVYAAVERDPLDEPVIVERADEVEAAVAGLAGEIGAAGERMRRYADVAAFSEAIAGDEATRDGAPVVIAVLLAVTGRKREARERAREVPGDFAGRLERWLAGERPPQPPGSEHTISWSDTFTAAWQKARERQAEPPEVRAARPQASWGDVWETGWSLSRMLRGEPLPPGATPDRERAWEPVELAPAAAPLLERARERSPLRVLVDAFVTVQLEPVGPGRLRVLLAGTEVGTVRAPEGAGPASVPGKVTRAHPGEPLELAVQLPA